MSSEEPTIGVVEAADVRPLRQAVLRAGRPPEESFLPGDDHRGTRHVAAVLRGEVLSVGSVMCEAPPWEPGHPRSWRIRGMATRQGERGRGLGALVLSELIRHAIECGGTLLWCAARVPARPFYERFGLVTRGETFVSQGVDHVHMWRDLPTAGP